MKKFLFFSSLCYLAGAALTMHFVSSKWSVLIRIFCAIVSLFLIEEESSTLIQKNLAIKSFSIAEKIAIAFSFFGMGVIMAIVEFCESPFFALIALILIEFCIYQISMARLERIQIMKKR